MSGTRVHTPAPSVGDLLAGRKKGRHARTFQPVRRNSRHRGEREARFWRATDRTELQATLEAAKMHDLLGKQAGQRNGPLGHIGLQVLEALMSVVQWSNGRLDPAIDWIAKRIRRARSAVIRALKRLKDEGFLDWLRRTEVIEDAEGAGPRVRQISNAYRIQAPAKWARRIAQSVAHWRARRQQQGAHSAASTAEPPQVQDPALAAALARLEGAVETNASPPTGQKPVAGSKIVRSGCATRS